MDRGAQRQGSGKINSNDQQRNTGSRFDILADQSEMETDSVKDGMRTNLETHAEDQDGEEEVVMEGVEATAKVGDRVNITVSHMDLAEGLRPMGGLKMNIWVQMQDKASGSKKGSGRHLKDISNKLDLRPTIAKAPRPTQVRSEVQSNGAQRVLKRPGTPNSPSEFVTAPKKMQSDGSGLGRPPDPVATNKIHLKEMNPRTTNCADEEGSEGCSQGVPDAAAQDEDVAMAEVAADGSMVEAVRETQF